MILNKTFSVIIGLFLVLLMVPIVSGAVGDNVAEDTKREYRFQYGAVYKIRGGYKLF